MKDFWVFIVLTLIIWVSFQIGVSAGLAEALQTIEAFAND